MLGIRYERFCFQEVGINIPGAHHYPRHSCQDIYLATIYGRDFSFCGGPSQATWEALTQIPN
jgi:hypothetical protein